MKLIATLLIVLVFGFAPTAKAAVVDPDGAWCWFQDPRSVYLNGKTYTGFVNQSGDIVVSSYENATGQSSSATLKAGLQIDDHASPSIEVLPDDRLVVWYSAHSGTKMYYRSSTYANSIAAWNAEKTVPVNYPSAGYHYTYPNPVYLPAEGTKTYLFWRGGTLEPTVATTTNGINWNPARKLWQAGVVPYMKVVSNGYDTIHFFVSDSRPQDTAHNNLYHFYYKQGYFYRSDGSVIKSAAQWFTSPIKPSEATIIHNAEDDNSWNWDIALDSTGKPVVTYATFESANDHRYHYARWTGSVWEDTELTAGGQGFATQPANGEEYYSGGIVLDHSDTNIVYLSRQVGTEWNIEKWTLNGSWSSETISTGNKDVRPVVPRNHALGLDVIWMRGEYPHWTTYATELVGL